MAIHSSNWSSIAVVLLFSLMSLSSSLNVGDDICYDGYVMDRYCINRGTLLDNPSVSPFLNPEVHSVHCLVDVKQCVESGYEIMSLEIIKNGMHGRTFRLDGNGNDKIVKFARENGLKGRCASCTGTNIAEHISEGFRAIVVGKVVSKSTGTRPAIISLTEIIPSDTAITSSTGISDKCPDGINFFEGPFDYSFKTNFHAFIYAHASMMLIGWGTLIPLGVIIAKLGRHLKPDGLWFKIHRPLQIIGLSFTLVGWIIALTQFTALEHGKGKQNIHTRLGMVVMFMGLLQPLNAFLRPHHNADDKKTKLRFAWEILHKSFGYMAVLLAVVVIAFGTMILPRPEDPKKFQMAYGLGSGLILLSSMIYLIWDKQQNDDHDSSDNTTIEQNVEKENSNNNFMQDEEEAKE